MIAGYSFMRSSRGRRALIISALLIVMAASTGPTAFAREQLPTARILSVEYPSDILPGERFAVLVTAEYSDAYSTDIAILDAATGFVLAAKGLIIHAGQNAFSFALTGPGRTGVWALLATARVWWHDGWYGNPDGGTYPFEITVTDPTYVTLSIRSNLASSVVTVDDDAYTVPADGVELSTTRGLHRLEAESPIVLDGGTRAVFDHWSDGVQSSPRMIYLGTKIDLMVTYMTEFSLEAESSVGETVGSGWYPAGMNATFAVLDRTAKSGSLTDLEAAYKFSHWSGDSDATSPVASVVMNQPRTVVAVWSKDTTQAALKWQLLTASLFFLSCSAILTATTLALRRRTRTKIRFTTPSRKTFAIGIVLMLVFFAAFTFPQTGNCANALTLLEPESVEIGDAIWYHWNQTASDTLLVWLGGGTVEQMGYLVNPYEFESYNTMLFIQDLARYYDVLALEKGPVRSVDPTLNRTFFREPYPSSNNFIEKIRIWADERGYTYLYVVGYSVGAMVAATELILANAAKWTSPDGLIIITTKIPEVVLSKADSLRASLLLLYGDKVAPEFIRSGETFFQTAPQDGWRDGFRYHKEYHLIPDVEHEVWTVKDSGEYDGRAVLLTVKFIETTKGLQFERASDGISSAILNLTASTERLSPFQVIVASVDYPGRVGTGEAFRVTSTVRYDLSSNITVAVVAFDASSAATLSAAEKPLSGRGEAQLVSTLLSGDKAGTLSPILVLLVATKEGWVVIGEGIRNVFVDVTDSYTLTVIIGYPNVPVVFDGQTALTAANGELIVNATPGAHVISVPPTVTLENTSRLVFKQWNDSSASPTLQIDSSGDLTLYAIYRRQHHLNVTSPFGQAAGSGWYDENATAFFHVEPPVLVEQTVHVFERWFGDSADSSPASSVFMNDSKNIQASWKDFEPTRSDNVLWLQILLGVSFAMLLASLLFAVLSLGSRRRSRPTKS
jgi:hypothetical protein